MIYISISCLGYDSELKHTIESAFDNATNPENITMGIAFIGNLDFYESLKETISKYPNIKKCFVPQEGNLGIGKGRLLSRSLYENEEYFLQVDSHSHFFPGWDEYVVDRFKAATEFIGHNKVVLSGYLSGYEFIKDRITYTTNLNYPTYIKNMRILGSLLRWTNNPPDKISKKMEEEIEKTGFAPLVKIMAGFMFGNKELANNLGIDESIIFWEEEVTQSIELIDKGFTLMYPGTYSPIAHRYAEGTDPKRDNIFYIYKNIEPLMVHNYHKYILNNEEKIKRYEEYAKVNLITGPEENFLYPDYYINK